MTNIGNFNPAFITLNPVEDGKSHQIIVKTEDIKQIGKCVGVYDGVSSAIKFVNRGKDGDVVETAYLNDTVSEIANKLNISA